MRKRAKKSDGVRVHHGVKREERWGDGVKDDHKEKSDGVRVDHEKDRWGENTPLERAMG